MFLQSKMRVLLLSAGLDTLICVFNHEGTYDCYD